jgi:hypothetical protein
MGLFGNYKKLRKTSQILLVPKPTVGGKILKPKPIEEKKK